MKGEMRKGSMARPDRKILLPQPGGLEHWRVWLQQDIMFSFVDGSFVVGEKALKGAEIDIVKCITSYAHGSLIKCKFSDRLRPRVKRTSACGTHVLNQYREWW